VCIDDDIPVIGVVMNDLRTQAGELWRDGFLEPAEKTLDESLLLRIRDEVQPLPRASGVPNIPIDLADCPRMNKTSQCGIEFAKPPAEIAHQLERPFHLRKRHTRQPVDQSNGVPLSACGLDRSQKLAGSGSLQMRNRQFPAGVGEMTEKRD